MLNLNDTYKLMMRGKTTTTLLKYKASIIDFSILFFIFLWLLDYFEPKYLFSNMKAGRHCSFMPLIVAATVSSVSPGAPIIRSNM